MDLVAGTWVVSGLYDHAMRWTCWVQISCHSPYHPSYISSILEIFPQEVASSAQSLGLNGLVWCSDRLPAACPVHLKLNLYVAALNHQKVQQHYSTASMKN